MDMNEYSEIEQNVVQLKSDVKQLLSDFTKLKHVIGQCKTGSGELRQKFGGSVLGLNLNSMINKSLRGFSNQLAYNLTGTKAQDYPRLFGQAMANMFGGTRASGGNVASGRSYIVGERGPEVFTPSTSGYVTSNNQPSGRPVNLVMHINAIDAESFKRSQNQIWAEASRAMYRAGRNL